jgi:hypothetical protein
MNIQERIKAFAELGGILRKSITGVHDPGAAGLAGLIEAQHKINGWFTTDNVITALSTLAEQLTIENLTEWTSAYPGLKEETSPIKVAVIMAGNIPLAGFHDYLSVLISGNYLLAKTSSKDSELIVKISDILFNADGRFRDRIEFVSGPLRDFDAIIATGSNNSSRYFEYYFGRYPNIIRRNRNSIAVLDGTETGDELKELGKDIFLYFGLGCRSVSKIFLPDGYSINSVTDNWDDLYADIINQHKYANNYDFNKAVYLVNRVSFTDTGYLLLREDPRLSSPVAVLHYEYYNDRNDLEHKIESEKDRIQCIVGHGYLPFGTAQSPYLWDYADGIDTLEFLSKKNRAGIL